MAFAALLSLIHPSLCTAEKIYLKDGKIVQGKVTARNRGCVWLKHPVGETGISLKHIDRITNDDGSISKYDYKSLSRSITESIRQKKYAEAARLCGLLLESFPNHPPTRYLHGTLSQKVGNLKDAAEDYDFLVKHDKADAAVYNNLGTIRAAEKRYGEAASMFSEAIKKKPEIAAAHNNLANLSMETKDYPSAIREYSIVLKTEPANTEVLYRLGVANHETGHDSKAKECWDNILRIDPKNDSAKKALEALKSKK